MTDIRFTLAEAAPLLNPPVTPEQLAAMVRALRLHPSGTRRTGRPGRPEQTWDWATITRLHECILPFLEDHHG
jgi:hypothetical protein